MSFKKIYLHCVWTTKNRKPWLRKPIRSEIFQHIKKYAHSKNIFIDQINGYVDHVHILLSLTPDQRVSEIIQLLKGESSYWINKQKFYHYHFSWQDDYYAISVSPGQIIKTRDYIKSQFQHHKRYNLDQEMEEFQKEISEEFFGGAD